MAYDGNHFRISAIGTFLGGVEEWSWSLAYGQPGGWVGPDDAITPAILDGVAEAIATYHTTVSSKHAQLTAVKIAVIASTGRYLWDAPPALKEFDPPRASASTALYPPQIALAVTLRTARRRGAGASGRFYIPQPLVTLQDSGGGLLQESVATNQANSAVTMLNAVTAALGPTGNGPIVASQGGAGRPPANVPVTRVEVGRVLDTIRRRRRQLREEHMPAATALSQPLGGG